MITNTTPLTHLTKAGLIWVLPSLYGRLIAPQVVIEEFEAHHGRCSFGWIDVIPVERPVPLTRDLDPGEAAVITLMLERDQPGILDDAAARQVANQAGLRFTGTLGVLAEAHDAGLLPDLPGALHTLKDTGFRISDTVVMQILQGRR